MKQVSFSELLQKEVRRNFPARNGIKTLSQTLPKALPLETANFCVQKFDKKLRFMLAGGFVYNERSRRLSDLRESETFDFPLNQQRELRAD